ncbi:MAG: ribonuclease J [Myxococcota bacterium]
MAGRHTLDFLPLGGAGEIGMNLNLYATENRWLMVDAGVMFERSESDEMTVLYPDTAFIESRREQLEGLVITHAHQDHLGAVADLWPRLQCPVYATPFAAAMLEGPLDEAGLLGRVPVRTLQESGTFKLGPFEIERIPLTHSTVEMGALVIRTKAGTVLHTGDWKLDPDPVVGAHTDEAALRRLADEGVDVVVSDSTNADVPGWTPSEGDLPGALRRVFQQMKGRIFVPFFSSNVARVATLGRLADELERDIIFVGRSLQRTVAAAQRVGYLDNLPRVVPTRMFGYLPPERVLVLCTGSQGEPRAGLARIAADEHPFVYIEPNDAVVFSARTIPGSEDALERLLQMLSDRGAKVVTDDDAFVHVSGHPRQDELRTLYKWVRPSSVLPVHGTPKKLEAHATLAEEMGLGAIRVRNGQRVRLGPQAGKLIEEVPTGRVLRVETAPSPPPRSRRERRRR